MSPSGRRPLFETATTNPLRVRVTPATRRTLDQIAKATGQPATDLVRAAINRYTDDYGGRRVFRQRH